MQLPRDFGVTVVPVRVHIDGLVETSVTANPELAVADSPTPLAVSNMSAGWTKVIV